MKEPEIKVQFKGCGPLCMIRRAAILAAMKGGSIPRCSCGKVVKEFKNEPGNIIVRVGWPKKDVR